MSRFRLAVSVYGNPYGAAVARPKRPDGALVPITLRVPEPVRERVEQIARAEGVSRSEWLARVVSRAVEAYPLGEN